MIVCWSSLLALRTRATLADVDQRGVPDDKLTLRTFMEAFVGYFYGIARDVMGPKRAKRYFPIIGGSACFIFFANLMTLIPGFSPPTSSLNITLGCALTVFILFNYYGLQANGFGYVKHLAGPKWYLAPLIFPIELISTCVRPVTLSIRLMVNMAVDHLLGHHRHRHGGPLRPGSPHVSRGHRHRRADARFLAPHVDLHWPGHRARGALR